MIEYSNIIYLMIVRYRHRFKMIKAYDDIWLTIFRAISDGADVLALMMVSRKLRRISFEHREAIEDFILTIIITTIPVKHSCLWELL